MFPRMQLVMGTQVSSHLCGEPDHPLSKAWIAPCTLPKLLSITSHSHRQSLACQIQPLGEAMGRKISLPWLAFQSTYESAGIGEKHNCPRLGSLLFFAAERPSVWPVLEAPRCLRLWPQIIVILVGKAWGVQSVRLDCSTCAGQFCDLGQANLLL